MTIEEGDLSLHQTQAGFLAWHRRGHSGGAENSKSLEGVAA